MLSNSGGHIMSKRSIITTIIIPIILILVLVIVIINNQQEYPGKLVFAQEKVNFGTIPEWEGTVTRSVTAKNEGRSPLRIEKIRPGCSYAKITGPKLLQPDEEGTFDVVLNPKIVPTDAKAATAILFTDSPRTPQVYLTIVAVSKRFATLSAEICDFGQILPESTHEKKIKLCVNMPLNLEEIRLIPSAHPSLTWNMSPDPNSECFLITIKLSVPKKWKQGETATQPYNAEKLLSSVLSVAFPNARTLTLPITARIVRPVTVQPETLSFGAVDKGITPSAEFTLSAENDFKVLSIQVSNYLRITAPDDWTQSLHAYNEHLQHEKRFKVSWDVDNSPMLLRQQIKILTTAEKIPIIIPIYGLIHSVDGKMIKETKR